LLKNIRDLNLQWASLDGEALLKAVPKLERLRGFDIAGLLGMKQDFGTLRSIDIQPYVAVSLLLKVLSRLLGLEDLQFEGTMFEPY
jgi:hypothetical protein